MAWGEQENVRRNVRGREITECPEAKKKQKTISETGQLASLNYCNLNKVKKSTTMVLRR